MKHAILCLAPWLISCLCLLETATGGIVAPRDGATVYHYLFVSANTTDAMSGYYADYASFVTTEASYNPALGSLASTWYALVSTNLDGHAAKEGLPMDTAPIYNTYGERIADSIAEMWLGHMAWAPAYDQYGNYVPLSLVWTGSTSQGNFWNNGLGVDPGHVGIAGSIDHPWMNYSNDSITAQHSVYGLSGLVNASASVPEPSSLLIVSAAVSTICGLRLGRNVLCGRGSLPVHGTV